MLFGFCSSALYQNCCGIVYQFCLRDMYCSNLHHIVELRNLKTSASASHCLDFAHVHYTVTIVGLCIGFIYGICTVVTYATAWGFKTQHCPLAPHWYTLFGLCSCALYHSYCGIVCRFCLRDFLGGGDSSVVRAPDLWLKGHGFESLQERRENFLLQGRLSVLTYFGIRSTPCYHSST